MKRMYVLITLLISMLVLSSTASAQKLDQFLQKLQVGDWVEFEGLPQKDFSILVEEIEVLRGEMEDDDFEVSGPISRVSLKDKTAYMVNLPVKFTQDAEYDEDNGVIKSFSDIKSGMYVEIEGTYQRDGTFMSDEIATEDYKADEKGFVDWTGKVEAIDLASKTITVFGHVITLTQQTKIKSFVH